MIYTQRIADDRLQAAMDARDMNTLSLSEESGLPLEEINRAASGEPVSLFSLLVISNAIAAHPLTNRINLPACADCGKTLPDRSASICTDCAFGRL